MASLSPSSKRICYAKHNNNTEIPIPMSCPMQAKPIQETLIFIFLEPVYVWMDQALIVYIIQSLVGKAHAAAVESQKLWTKPEEHGESGAELLVSSYTAQ